MKISLAIFRCADCNRTFEAPFCESPYGEFLLRSRSGNLAHLNAIEDTVYGEVKMLVAEIVGCEDPFQIADMLQRIFGSVACDPDLQGSLYSINGQPSCPVCQSGHIASWELIEPKKELDLEVLEITHRKWAILSHQQKREVVIEAIRQNQ